MNPTSPVLHHVFLMLSSAAFYFHHVYKRAQRFPKTFHQKSKCVASLWINNCMNEWSEKSTKKCRRTQRTEVDNLFNNTRQRSRGNTVQERVHTQRPPRNHWNVGLKKNGQINVAKLVTKKRVTSTGQPNVLAPRLHKHSKNLANGVWDVLLLKKRQRGAWNVFESLKNCTFARRALLAPRTCTTLWPCTPDGEPGRGVSTVSWSSDTAFNDLLVRFCVNVNRSTMATSTRQTLQQVNVKIWKHLKTSSFNVDI